MRYALVSDIHANMQAWKAVHEDILSNNVDRIICLGDVVGYGPNPREILRELQAKVDAFVLGNHDAALCGKLDESLFNDDARLVLDWTKKQIKPEDLDFLTAFPLTLIGDGFVCAHGEFTEPANFDYVTTAEEALPSWKANDANLMIVGHTHEPALYVMGASGTPRTVDPQDFVVDPGKRYFVNIGSVGQPRGGDLRACYCIYDSELRALYWRRVNFDQEAYRKALKATGLTLAPSYYLPEPKTGETPAAPKPMVFTPSKSPDKAAHDVIKVQDLKDIPRRKQKMPIQIKSALILILIVVSVLIWMRTHPASTLDGTGSKVIAASNQNVLSLPKGVIKQGKDIPGWMVRLDDRYKQRSGVNLDPFGQPFCYLASKTAKKEMLLASPWIAVKPRSTCDIDISFQQKKDYSGHVTLSVVLATPEKAGYKVVRELFRQEPAQPAAGDWTRIQTQFAIPDKGSVIQLQVRGKFSGTVLVKRVSLKLTGGSDEAQPVEPVTPAPQAAAPEAPAPQPATPEASQPAAPEAPASQPAAATEAPATPAPGAETTPAVENDPWKIKVK